MTLLNIPIPPVQQEMVCSPTLIAIGGGPASGKTTWRKQLSPETHSFFLHDMDEVLIHLPGYQEDYIALGAKLAFEKWWPTARELADASVRMAILSHESILYDRTCGAESSYRDLQQAKAEGYFICLIGLTVDRSVASSRVQERAAREGRIVTEEIIDEYRSRFSALWPRYLSFVDVAWLYDTTETPPRLLFSSRDGILDPARYQQFLDEGTSRLAE